MTTKQDKKRSAVDEMMVEGPTSKKVRLNTIRMIVENVSPRTSVGFLAKYRKKEEAFSRPCFDLMRRIRNDKELAELVQIDCLCNRRDPKSDSFLAKVFH